MRKKAIVTGGSSGIGRGVVYGLAREGYDVAFSYRSGKEKAQKVLNEITENYPEGKFYMFHAQLEQKGAGKAFFDEAAAALGGLDLLVNNAGVTIKESLFDLTEENTDYLISLLFKNYVFMMKEAATYMAKNAIRGSIVNISSTRADVAHTNDMIYGGIKAAINRACSSAALDAAPYGIRINNVLPGAIMRFTSEEEDLYADAQHVEKVKFLSERIPLKRYGTPEDVANAVIFLASEKAAYITGSSITVDGGLRLPGLAETVSDAESFGWGCEMQNRFQRDEQ